MREAADREDATEKAAVTPGPIKPARELLGEMLMQLKRPAEALAEFEATLTKEPNRFRAIYGAARAAEAAGQRQKASGLDARVVEISRTRTSRSGRKSRNCVARSDSASRGVESPANQRALKVSRTPLELADGGVPDRFR